MKFLVDANIPQSVISYLERLEHDVVDIKKVNSQAKDTELIELANKEGRIVITLDKDFIILTQFPKYKTPVIVIRLKDLRPINIIQYLDELISNQKEEILLDSLTIVRESRADSFSLKR